MNHLTELVITCSSWQEAQRIADALLEKDLVKNVETFEIRSKHWWESHQHGILEVKVIVLAPIENSQKIKILADTVRRTHTAPVLMTQLTK